MGSAIARVVVLWDERDGADAGWHARTYRADGSEGEDSEKVWFPVDLSSYTRTQRGAVVAALEAGFPGSVVEVA